MVECKKVKASHRNSFFVVGRSEQKDREAYGMEIKRHDAMELQAAVVY